MGVGAPGGVRGVGPFVMGSGAPSAWIEGQVQVASVVVPAGVGLVTVGR